MDAPYAKKSKHDKVKVTTGLGKCAAGFREHMLLPSGKLHQYKPYITVRAVKNTLVL